jgi:hypothetical protein
LVHFVSSAIVKPTASGTGAPFTNVAGATNTASGVAALGANTSGDRNTAFGANALQRSYGFGGLVRGIVFFRMGRPGAGTFPESERRTFGSDTGTRLQPSNSFFTPPGSKRTM